MRKAIAILLMVLSCLVASATNYYVSNAGNDANPGTLAQPWATISKVNSSMGTFVATDSILFQRGGVFTGTLNVTKAGIIFSAYGSGNKPIITGFYTIPSWTATANPNLWTATIPGGLNWVRLLTINDRVTRVGRQPNYADNATAWFRYNGALASVSPINVPASTAIPTNLADGELVLSKYNWNLDVMPINSISGTTINCNNPAGLFGIADGPGGNRGFFVQNSINALDVQNEWHYNNTTKVVTMFSTTNPSTLGTIKIPTQTNIVTLGGTSNITLDNLDIQGCSEKGITGTGSNITIKNCNVRCVQGWGIDVRGSNFNIQNNWIRDIGSNGIYVSQTGNISGNLIEACAAVEGLAGLTNSGAGTQGNQNDQHLGINIETSYSGSVTCRFNTLDSIGYNGIRWYGSNVTIEKNFINYPCIIKSDGGGIYTWQELVSPAFTNQVVKNNIILNSGKYLFGIETPGLNVNSYGIYLDAGARNVIVDSNVIGPCLYGPNSFCSPNPTQTVFNGGLYFNGVQNVTVRRNIVMNWPSGITLFRQTAAKVPVLNGVVSGLYITKNAFYVVGGGSALCDIETSERYYDYGGSAPATLISQIQGFGTIDSNYVAGTYAPSPFMYGSSAGNAGFPLTLTRWRSETGKDLNSVQFPNTTPEFQYNETGVSKTYSFSGRQKKDFEGNIYNNSATIPPYYGNIFFDNGPAQGTTLAAFSSATQINCAGGTSTVTVSATGGVPPYTGTGTFTVTAGTYTYTVTDAAANSVTTSVTVTQPTALSASSSKTNVLCSGGSTGTITVVPVGGTPNYTFNWGGGVTTQNRTGLPIGTYTCTITDSRGCTTTTAQTINQPAPLSAGSPTAPPILVNGGSTTITQPLPTGGTIPYLYQLNTGTFQSSNIFNSVTAGNYTVTIRDANNCTTASTISITQPTVFSATATAGTIACNGGSANVTVSASGGTPPYTGTGTFSRTAGTYVFTVTDAASATASANVTITQPTALAATISSTNVNCNGASTGTITLAPTGGTGAYTYLWNGGQTTQNRSALAAGTYSVVITDANGCTLTRSATINQPAALVITATPTPATIICNGGTSSVVIGASGGTAPYTGLGTFTQSAGTTTYTIADANSCPASAAVTLTQPAALTAPNPTSGTITVNGGTTTITQGAPTGGVSPYSYSLNTGAFQSSNIFTNVAAGTYTVNIRDANGCTITRSISITQPAVFSASAVRTGPVINCNGQNTIVTVSASGGTAPYTGTGTFTTPAGSYNYTVTDALGNTASASIVITQPTQVVPSIAAGSITSIGGTTNVVVSATGGVSPYTGVGTFTRNAGLYAFTVTDSNGCSSVATISLNDPVVIPNQILILNSVFRNGN